MAEPLTQARINAIVARAAQTVREISPDPRHVFELPGTPEQAAASAHADGWCDIGTVIDTAERQPYAVWWHPELELSRFVWWTGGWGERRPATPGGYARPEATVELAPAS